LIFGKVPVSLELLTTIGFFNFNPRYFVLKSIRIGFN